MPNLDFDNLVFFMYINYDKFIDIFLKILILLIFEVEMQISLIC